MGFFAVIFSIAIVLIQTTSILLNREANQWSFYILKKTPNTTYLSQLNDIFSNQTHSPDSNTQIEKSLQWHHDLGSLETKANSMWYTDYAYIDNQNNQLNLSVYFFNSLVSSQTQTACLKSAWDKKQTEVFPVYCLMNTHLRQTIEQILVPINPHLLLLTIAIIHCIFCLSKSRKMVWPTLVMHNNDDTLYQKENAIGLEPPNTFSLPISTTILYLILIVVYIIQGTKNQDLVQYTTIILTVILLIAGIMFVFYHNSIREDHLLFNNWHFQLVVLPTAILSICIIGTRFWNDILYHIIILSTAGYTFCISATSTEFVSQKISQIISFFSPLLSLYIAFYQWGGIENWKYAMGLMGCSSLLPYLIYPVFLSTSMDNDNSDTKDFQTKMKYLSKITLLTSSCALISLVVNIGMFYDDNNVPK